MKKIKRPKKIPAPSTPDLVVTRAGAQPAEYESDHHDAKKKKVPHHKATISERFAQVSPAPQRKFTSQEEVEAWLESLEK